MSDDINILWNAMLHGTEPDEEGRLVVRYLQVGVAGPNGFSGLVTDYCGGGEWDDLYLFEGQPVTMDEDEDEEAEEMDADACEEWLEERAPGLPDAVSATWQELVGQADGDSVYPFAAAGLLAVIGDSPDADTLYSNAPGALPPEDGFNTGFGDEA